MQDNEEETSQETRPRKKGTGSRNKKTE